MTTIDLEEQLRLTDFDPSLPVNHYYPYRVGMIIRPGDKAFCGHVYDGWPYKARDGREEEPPDPCIVCEQLVRSQ